MRLPDEELREALAAEYVLGTQTARVRRRFQALLRYDARLRARVAHWEERLAPLALGAPERSPPERVWRAIEARMARTRQANRFPGRPGFWRAIAVASLALLIPALGALLALTIAEPAPNMVAVLENDRSEPAIVVAWTERGKAVHEVKVQVVAHPHMPPDTAWQLWVIPADDPTALVSAGFVATGSEQRLAVPKLAAAVMANAWGFAVSVEPKGGSPIGRPSGPVIFKGPCVKLI